MFRRGKTSSRLLTPLVLIAAFGLLATGCSRASTEDSASAVVTATPTPTPSPSPAFPAAGRKATRSSAVTFVRHFFAVYNHAVWTANAAGVRALSDPTCTFCKQAGLTVDSLKTNNRRAEGGRITITDARGRPGTITKGIRVDVAYNQAPSQIVDRDGKVLSVTPATQGGQAAVAVKWTGKKWIVLEVLINGAS